MKVEFKAFIFKLMVLFKFTFLKAIFASALNYVQEREEPIDFLDLF